MWILNFIPDIFIHLLVLAGIAGSVAGIFLGVIPIIGKYRLPIQVISLVILSVGLFLEGGLSNQKDWRIKVAELETEIAKTRENAAKINTKIVTQVITKKQVIRERGEEVVKYIDREVVKYDKSCPIPQSVISAHDAAAKNATVIDPTEIDAAAKPKTPIRLPSK